MRLLKILASLISLNILIISGCGGGGGGGGGGDGGGGDTGAPTVAMTAPSSSSIVSGSTVVVSASASDYIGVTKVEFYINSVLQTTITASPYSFNWNTVPLTNGIYTIYAKAYDAAGNIGQSLPVQVTVANLKTAKLIFSSYSTNPADQLGGFDLTVKLPAGASIKTDAAGVPLSTAVYLSGQFAGSAFVLNACIRQQPKVIIDRICKLVNSYDLGEFLTVICDVPSSYTPNVNDVVIQTFTAFSPVTGISH